MQPVTFPAASVLLAGVAHWLAPLPGLPWALRLIGTVPLLVGLVVVAWSVVHQFRRGNNPEIGRPTGTLVTDGPYAWSRNPIYVGFLLTQTGLGLLLDWWIALVLLPAAWYGLRRFVVLPEERQLAGLFGAAYAAYCRQVPRWL